MKYLLLLACVSLVACGGFQAKRVDSNESDEKALEITDKWLAGDTERAIKDILKKISAHRGFKRYLMKNGDAPKVFIAKIDNKTSESYFPIDDISDELLNEMSASGDFVLVDAAARDAILEEITYQHDGMVDPATAKMVGKQTGADLLIFGNVHMKPATRSGKTIKQYSVNIRITDIERGVEVLRTRTKLNKYSEKGGMGW